MIMTEEEETKEAEDIEGKEDTTCILKNKNTKKENTKLTAENTQEDTSSEEEETSKNM